MIPITAAKMTWLNMLGTEHTAFRMPSNSLSETKRSCDDLRHYSYYVAISPTIFESRSSKSYSGCIRLQARFHPPTS